ncbi:hypothetical protein LUZ62_054420 [Rhynchospora pubera]|uniref:Protein NUCLEAR FUSION DEFECTIVE 6, chloroplastic/mitochondrial-like n=1 Tax=Rhynchospora pubera TaxID=906938 RepID=A0AAV8DV56_9POAL|nr:hypothetical protein LUZ62_054420 [Rhynchospora pubera]
MAALRSRALVRNVSASLRNNSASKSSIGLELPSAVRPIRRTSTIHRLPLMSAGLLSSLPLHSAIASCRLRSVLSAESQSWGLIPQGMMILLCICYLPIRCLQICID